MRRVFAQWNEGVRGRVAPRGIDKRWGLPGSRASRPFPGLRSGPRALGVVADYILPAAFFATSRSLSSSIAAIAVRSFALAAVS